MLTVPNRMSARPTISPYRFRAVGSKVAIALGAFLALWLGVGHAETLTGKVVRVADGDTITILTDDKQQHRIRLAGIDAPEKNQAFGDKSRQNLVQLANQKEARLECHKTDRYQRKVCKVTADSLDLSLEQLKAGLAWWYRAYAKEQTEQDRKDYEQAETQARSAGAGLWGDRAPAPPWEWRKMGLQSK